MGKANTNSIAISPIGNEMGRRVSDVAHTDRRLKCSLSQLGLDISIKPALGSEHALILRPSDDFDQEMALSVIENTLQPAPKAEIVRWLAVLRAITAHRQIEDRDLQLAMAVFVERLSAYPADVVHHVLLRERWKFWPALAEVEERCDALVAPRQRLALYVRRGFFAGQPAESPKRELISDEARRRILAECGFARTAQQPAPRPDDKSAASRGSIGELTENLLHRMSTDHDNEAPSTPGEGCNDAGI